MDWSDLLASSVHDDDVAAALAARPNGNETSPLGTRKTNRGLKRFPKSLSSKECGHLLQRQGLQPAITTFAINMQKEQFCCRRGLKSVAAAISGSQETDSGFELPLKKPVLPHLRRQLST